MMKVLKKKRKGGFTLIELIVVIAIIGILALIAVPRLGGFQESARIAADEQYAAIVSNAAILWMATNAGTPTIANLETANLIQSGVTLKSAKYNAITITAGTAPVTVVVRLQQTAGTDAAGDYIISK